MRCGKRVPWRLRACRCVALRRCRGTRMHKAALHSTHQCRRRGLCCRALASSEQWSMPSVKHNLHSLQRAASPEPRLISCIGWVQALHAQTGAVRHSHTRWTGRGSAWHGSTCLRVHTLKVVRHRQQGAPPPAGQRACAACLCIMIACSGHVPAANFI